jgi:hypothetical protein
MIDLIEGFVVIGSFALMTFLVSWSARRMTRD